MTQTSHISSARVGEIPCKAHVYSRIVDAKLHNGTIHPSELGTEPTDVTGKQKIKRALPRRAFRACFSLFALLFYISNFLLLGLGSYFFHQYYLIKITYRVAHAFAECTWDDFQTGMTILGFIPKRFVPDFQNEWHLVIIGIVILTYGIYWRKTGRLEERGSKIRLVFRRLWIYRYIADYFPVQLVPSDELQSFAQRVNGTKSLNDSLKSVSHDKTGSELSDSSIDTSTFIDDSKANVSIDKSQIDHGYPVRDGETIVYDTTDDKPVVSLPVDRNYLCGCHPHGIFSFGAFFNFATDATGFDRIFPRLNRYLAVLKIHFEAPFYRDYIMSYGIISAARASLRYLLDKNQCGRTGNFVVVIVGGAEEALDAVPGLYCVHLKTRHGFFKMALETGASLVPAISFGETNTYSQLPNRPGSRLRRIQEYLMSIFTFSLPIIYAWGLVPYRSQITTVIGEPIAVEKVGRPTFDEINACRDRYVAALTALFKKYKPLYDPEGDDIYFR